MVAQGPSVLISYHKGLKNKQDDYVLAQKLRNELFRPGITVDVKTYDDSISSQGYQWLILVYNNEVIGSPVNEMIDRALKQVVKRKMQGVLAVTNTPTEPIGPWKTIPLHYATNEKEKEKVARDIMWAMFYVKQPYVAPSVRNSALQVLSGGKNSPRGALLKIVVMLVLFVLMGGIFSFVFAHMLPSPVSQSPDEMTATARASLTPSPQPSVTLADKQQQYDDVWKHQQTIISDFQKPQWSEAKPSCILDDPSNYHVKVEQSGHYTLCEHQSDLKLTGFVYRVTMEIHGGAGGLVFGFHDNNQGYYRVDITNNSSGANKLTVHYCSANSCTSHNADDGQSLATTTPSIDKQNQLTLAVMVNDDNYISFYVQGKYVTSISSSSGPASGQIGVYAVSFDSNPSEGTDASHPNGSTASSNTQGKTEVLFTKVQVWQFPLPSPSPSKPI